MPSAKGRDSRHQLFDENSPEYFPSACCEFLHVQSALYLASFIQLVFVLLLSLLYLLLEQSQFINAVDVFRPGVAFVICTNLVGILCALVGVCSHREQYISTQISILIGLVLLSDLFALLIIFAMAFGARVQLASHLTFQQFLHSFLIDERRWEALLGPFWPYLLAILFHMAAWMFSYADLMNNFGGPSPLDFVTGNGYYMLDEERPKREDEAVELLTAWKRSSPFRRGFLNGGCSDSVLRFGKRGPQHEKKAVPGVLRFGKRAEVPGVLRFGKRMPQVLRFG
uniref:Uncharacterized protein n=1 Tax=Globodera pallida TaxID=36090 RepID=A0A183BVS8_GLOPA